MKKNKLLKLLAIILIFPIIIFCSACSNSSPTITISSDGYWVINGEKTTTKARGQDGKNGLDGKDGKDAPQFTIKDAYDALIEEGSFDGTFEEFIKDYFNFDVDFCSVVANQARKSIVIIKTSKGTKTGSGVIYHLDKDNGNAFILTNYHVVTPYLNNDTISVYLEDDSLSPITAEYVCGEFKADLAVLKITNNNQIKHAEATQFAEKPVSAGDICIAIGNAHTKGISVTIGTVSVESEIIDYYNGENGRHPVLRHCAYIAKGSSGGGLFNLAGQLIGITNASEKGEVTLMNYAVPIDVVNQFLTNNENLLVF